MKIVEVQLRDMTALAGLPGVTSMLTAEHCPERDEMGWIRFKAKDGSWHRIPPDLVRRVTEYRDSDKNIENPITEAKRGPGRPAKTV